MAKTKRKAVHRAVVEEFDDPDLGPHFVATCLQSGITCSAVAWTQFDGPQRKQGPRAIDQALRYLGESGWGSFCPATHVHA